MNCDKMMHPRCAGILIRQVQEPEEGECFGKASKLKRKCIFWHNADAGGGGPDTIA